MRHLVLLLLLIFPGYFVWAYATRKEKGQARKFAKRHIKATALIVLALLAGVVFAFYNRSINLL